MAGDTYRITSPTMVLFLEEGRHVSEMIPADSIIVVQSETFNGDRLIEVLWAERRVMMFTQDIRSRGEKISK